MNKVFKLVIIVAFILVGLSLAKDVLIKASVEKGVKIATGLGLEMKHFHTSILGQSVAIKDLRILNPKSFQDKTMVEMPEIYIHFDLKSVLGGKLHFYEARINLKEFQVVKNKDGALNLDALKALQGQKKGAKPEEKPKSMPIQIDVLQLKIDRVVYKDYSMGANPTVMPFDLNLNEKFTNVTDFNALTSIIVVKALRNTTIGKLANIDLGNLQSTVSGTLASAQNLAVGSMGDVSDKATDVLENTADSIGGATEKLTGLLKIPFGAAEKDKK